MRTLILATAAAALVAAPTVADAQQKHAPRPGTTMPRPGGTWTGPRPGMRWGNKVGGRWWVGARAPGGWTGYRTPMIGWTLPSYWISPSYYVTNWSGYGLPMAPDGYYWSRYYDDAVMIDAGGRVRDYRSGLDWDRYDNGAYSVETYVDGKLVERHELDGGYDAYAGDDRGPPPPPPPPPARRANDGAVTGAVVGGVVGGVAGNVIAGRGNRAVGTILGAGVGAVAGAAIGGAQDRREPPVAPYGAPYPPPGHGAMHGPMHGDAPPPPVEFAPPREVVQGAPGIHHRERIVERHIAGRPMTFDTNAYGGRPYTTVVRGPGTVTTVTVIPATTTTTTTTEYVYEAAPRTYRKTVKRTYRPKAKSKTCYCR